MNFMHIYVSKNFIDIIFYILTWIKTKVKIIHLSQLKHASTVNKLLVVILNVSICY